MHRISAFLQLPFTHSVEHMYRIININRKINAQLFLVSFLVIYLETSEKHTPHTPLLRLCFCQPQNFYPFYQMQLLFLPPFPELPSPSLLSHFCLPHTLPLIGLELIQVWNCWHATAFDLCGNGSFLWSSSRCTEIARRFISIIKASLPNGWVLKWNTN